MDTAENGNTETAPKLRSVPGDPLCQNILPLADWVLDQEESGDPEACPPCDLATIAPWYRDLLEKHGYPELAAKVQALAEGEHDALEVAEVLDELKDLVENEEIGNELLLYDCMMQKYKEEEV